MRTNRKKWGEKPFSKDDSQDLLVTKYPTSKEDNHAKSSKEDNRECEEILSQDNTDYDDFNLFDIDQNPNATKLSASINDNVDEEHHFENDTTTERAQTFRTQIMPNGPDKVPAGTHNNPSAKQSPGKDMEKLLISNG